MAKILGWLTDAVLVRRQWFVVPQVLLLLGCILYTVGFLQFDSSRSNLVGADKQYHQNFLKFRKEFPAQDDLVVIAESTDAEKNRQFVERLGAKLEAETNLFTDVFYKGDLRILGRKALLFVPEKDLVELRKTLQEYKPFINQFTRATNLVSLFDLINTQFRTAPREQTAETESLINALPVLERIVAQADDSLHRFGAAPSPGISALFGAGEQAEQKQYITFGNGRLYLVTAHAPTDALNGPAIRRLRQLVDETKTEVPGLNVGITGEPVLELDEMAQSQRDSTVATILSLVLCALIFIYGYQETGRPIKATLCLIVGLGYTMGFTTLSVKHLNILTITFLPILIGLAIDFGVHLITRFEEELRRGRSEAEALRKAMVFTGQGIFTGAFTTAGAFLAMGFTNFKGIQEMGVISGGGLLICLIPMMTLLPVLLLRGKQNVINHEAAEVASTRARIEQFWLQRPVLVVVLSLGLCALSLTQFSKVYFDYNLLNMQSKGLPAVVFEKKLISATVKTGSDSRKGEENGKSLLFAAVVADSLPKAVALEKRIEELPTVASVDSMAEYLTENQAEKLVTIRQIKEEIEAIRFADFDDRSVQVGELSRSLWSLQGYCGIASTEVEKDDPKLFNRLISLRDAIVELRKDMLGRFANVAPEKLASFQQALFSDVRQTFQALKEQDTSGPMRAEDLPDALRNRFVGVTGKYLLQVYPKKDVWQRENQKEFINDLRTVDPDATGTPVQLYEYTSLLRKSYEQAALYSLGAVAILVFIHFRNIVSVLLSLLPVAVGSIWLGGIMGYFGIPFNPANIMILPLVIGIGVTNGIHILNRFAEEHSPGILAKSTGKAVFVSGLTTIAGFGSLIVGKHQGIQSLGYVMAIGVSVCMIAGLVFLPALMNLLKRWKIIS